MKALIIGLSLLFSLQAQAAIYDCGVFTVDLNNDSVMERHGAFTIDAERDDVQYASLRGTGGQIAACSGGDSGAPAILCGYFTVNNKQVAKSIGSLAEAFDPNTFTGFLSDLDKAVTQHSSAFAVGSFERLLSLREVAGTPYHYLTLCQR